MYGLAFLKQSHMAQGKFIYEQEAEEGLEGGCCKESHPGRNFSEKASIGSGDVSLTATPFL